MDISKIDKNFEIKTRISKENIRFYNVENEPFSLYGVFKENGKFRRMPEDVAKKVSEGVYGLHIHTAGGRVRFSTDSPYVAVHVKIDGIWFHSHFTVCATSGFDIYADNTYMGTYMPPAESVTMFEGVVELNSRKMREICINFPLYNSVNELYIGLDAHAKIEKAAPYKIEKPIVYYGSSITQGGCASRPGTCYQAYITRELSVDHINLGFSGNAKAEDTIIDYIKGLNMSAFVLDYDHNSPSCEHLKSTHEKMLLAVRENHPLLPIIIMNRPKLYLDNDEQSRLEIIRETYKNALGRGDKNVYLIDNTMLCAMCGNEGTVDTCHPTDYGFASMANAIIPVLKEALK